MSRQAFREAKQDLELYQQQQFPELIYSRVDHSQRTSVSKVLVWNKELPDKSDALSLREILNIAVEKAQSLAEFVRLIEQQGLRPYYRNGVLTGVWYGRKKQRKYRLKKLGVEPERLMNQEIFRNR